MLGYNYDLLIRSLFSKSQTNTITFKLLALKNNELWLHTWFCVKKYSQKLARCNEINFFKSEKNWGQETIYYESRRGKGASVNDVNQFCKILNPYYALSKISLTPPPKAVTSIIDCHLMKKTYLLIRSLQSAETLVRKCRAWPEQICSSVSKGMSPQIMS